jgi:hypothetical protein
MVTMKKHRKPNKYRNKKVIVNGEIFDSEKEYKRYRELLLLEKAGAITDLKRQVKFVLVPTQYETFERYGKRGRRLKDGKRCVERGVDYYADFVYTENGKQVVEDTKSEPTKTESFVIKRKLMLYIHGIRVRER